MHDSKNLNEIKKHITSVVQRCTDEGFIPCTGCNKISKEMEAVLLDNDRNPDKQDAFDVAMFVVLRMSKLVERMDTSSGAAGDVIYNATNFVRESCDSDDGLLRKYYIDKLIATAKNNIFIYWPDTGFELLGIASSLVTIEKERQKILEVMTTYGELYSGKPYPDQLLITMNMIRRLDGEEATIKYMEANLETPEIREIGVKRALEEKNYDLAEKLSLEGKRLDPRNGIDGYVPWCAYLEKIYLETSQTSQLEQILREMLFGGLSDTFGRLEALYQKQGNWEVKEEPLWDEIAKAYREYDYASILAKHKKLYRLMAVLRNSPLYIYKYGKVLAKLYPEEIQKMYVTKIMEDAEAANQRTMYRKLCGKIKGYKAVAGREETIKLINQIMLKYPRRPAMLDELECFRGYIENK